MCILNSFLYSGLAVVICVLVGVPIAWLLARSSVPGRGALDAVNTLILAVPGTAIGIAYIRAFHFDLPGFDRGLTSFWIVMPLVLAVRRLPYTCLLYTSDAADERSSVDLGGRRIIKKKMTPSKTQEI